MAASSVRRSFHGPWLRSASGVHSVKRDGGVGAHRSRRQQTLELVPEPPSAGTVGRALLEAARREEPTSSARERILSQVLSALQLLTAQQK